LRHQRVVGWILTAHEPQSAGAWPATYIDPRRAAVYLAWTLAFAYSFAPFNFVFEQGRITRNFSLHKPLDLPHLVNLALHMLAFAAVGAADRFGSGKRNPGNRVFLPVLARGLLFCLMIEVGQIFALSRHADVLDLTVNAVGLSLGHLSVVRLRLDARARATLMLRSPRLRSVLLVIWALFWSSLLLIPSRFVTLGGWDSGYPLLIASEKNDDERTGVRTWRGEIQYVALYDRPLQPDQVRRSLDRRPGVPQSTLARLSMGLVVAYDFARVGRLEVEPEGRFDAPSLRIRLPYGSRWNVGSAALVPDDGGLLTTAGSAELLTTPIASSGTFSVEVWCRPADLARSGAATIVGISDSTWRSNFTLGQEGPDLYFRVRNRLNGPDGSRFELRSANALSTNLVQIVATYAQGVSSVFENGQRLSPTVDLREPSVLLGLGTAPVGGFVTAVLSALSLILLSSCFVKERATARGAVLLLLFGYSGLLLPLVFGALFSFRAATSLHLWFGPALVLSSALLVRIGRR
jgi:hypothetical protein